MSNVTNKRTTNQVVQNNRQVRASNQPSRPISPQQRNMQRRVPSNTGYNNQRAPQQSNYPQGNYQQGGYQQGNYQQSYDNQSEVFESDINNFKGWLILLLKLWVPVLNIITIVKLFKTKLENPVKYNFVVAYLIYFGASVVISLVLSLIIALI